MDVISLTRWVVVALYAATAVYAARLAVGARYDAESRATALFISACAAGWAGFYVWVFLTGPSELAIVMSRVAHLPVVGIFFVTLRGNRLRDQVGCP